VETERAVTLDSRENHKSSYKEMVTMVYEVRMTVWSTVEAKSKQEAKDKALESLYGNPLIDEVWVTGNVSEKED
jgi:hypothetical protein